MFCSHWPTHTIHRCHTAPPPGDSPSHPLTLIGECGWIPPPDDIPSLSQGSSAYQDAQRPFTPTDDEASPPPSPRAPPSKIQMAMAMDAFQDVPLGSLTPEEVVDFTHKTIRSTHPTEVRHLSPPHLASLRCTITQFDHSVSEMTERLEDSQQSHTDTLQEVAMAESLQQAANLAALERSVNHQTSILRADISRLAITSDNIQRTQADVTARLHPQSRVMHQLQKTASGFPLIPTPLFSTTWSTICTVLVSTLRRAPSFRTSSNQSVGTNHPPLFTQGHGPRGRPQTETLSLSCRTKLPLWNRN